MRASISGSVDTFLRWSPAQPLCRRRADRHLVVLAYHGVDDAAHFAWQMELLRSTMRPVALDDVLGAMAARRSLPPRSVLVTFDDGERSVLERALPILESREIPAVAFVVAGLVGTNEPFWWSEVEESVRRGGHAPGLPPGDPAGAVRALKGVSNDVRLARLQELRESTKGPPVRTRHLCPEDLFALEDAGIAIGNHTLTHPCLDRCFGKVVEREIREAHDALTGMLGAPPRAFAYPNGNHDPRAARVLTGLGYGAAFLFDHRIGRFPPSDPYRISRVRVSSTTDPDRFRIVLSGLHPALHHALGRA